ncbi:hypothetical protein SH2C18_38720 [Clostridium sediminicola]|uniref:Spo0E family sporulation regulatory protein-aspartic acid phosphatase n=1 Tax=Clostridium sediminicola TaxID=3114879 RepID=UPI0031F1EF85
MFNDIETTKKKLNNLIENLNYQLNDMEVIKLSQELDELILTYYERIHKKNKTIHSYLT